MPTGSGSVLGDSLRFTNNIAILPNDGRSAPDKPMNQKKTILFLEDERDYLSTLSSLLRDQGYNVVETSKTGDALSAITNQTPDMILADIKLGQGERADGFDFFEQVRKLEECRSVPFIFLTAYNNLEAELYAKKHGAADYITKPFDFEYLIARIMQLTPP
jgi:DNA-binding response OmpR family regulator